MIDSFNNWNIIIFFHKVTKTEATEEIYQVLLDDTSYNMASLVHYGKYCSMNKKYASKMGYYVIKFVSEAYSLQNDTTCDGQIISYG